VLHRLRDYNPIKLPNLAPALEWFSQRLKYRPIYDGDLLYLERFYVGRVGKYTIFLHKICASDPDRGVHDHPWNSFSILLAGSYDEEILVPQVQTVIDFISPSYRKGFPDRYGLGRLLTIYRRVHWFNRIPGFKFHRLVLIGSHPVWTLFIHGKRFKSWGFWRWTRFDVYNEPPSIQRESWTATGLSKQQIRRLADAA
jgi:hypothetical protein